MNNATIREWQKATQPAPGTATHIENVNNEKARLFYALELASDRLLLAGDKDGFAMTARILNSVSMEGLCQ